MTNYTPTEQNRLYTTDGKPVPDELMERLATLSKIFGEHQGTELLITTIVHGMATPKWALDVISDSRSAVTSMVRAFTLLFSLGFTMGYASANPAIDVDRFAQELYEDFATNHPTEAQCLAAARSLVDAMRGAAGR